MESFILESFSSHPILSTMVTMWILLAILWLIYFYRSDKKYDPMFRGPARDGSENDPA